MLTRRIRTCLMTAALTLAAVLSSQATADITAKEATDLNAQAKATLAKFKAGTKGSDAVLANAKGVLVCPKITKGGLVVGVEGGNCVLTSGSAKPLYYSTGAVKAGLLAGVQSYSMILAFNSAEAVRRIDEVTVKNILGFAAGKPVNVVAGSG